MTAKAKAMRLDQWLFRARLFKSRTLAAEHCKSGKIRVDGQIVRKASAQVAKGQVLTLPKADLIRVVKVLGYPPRRGPASEAAAFYQDLTPGQNRLKTNFVARPGKRPKGAGRPTKKERRAFERLRGQK